ncbi:hypothetical protein G6F56_004017 [Rhizopus delemar]|nr:hypothetical protein G6F56_004017 [Rhizopus delemar]
MYDVQGGYRADISDRTQDVKPVAVDEDTHFLVLRLQRSVFFDVLFLTLRVLHRPEIKDLSQTYEKLGQDYYERVLLSISNEVLKSIASQFDASELITQREVVSAKVREELYKRARDFNLDLEDVSIFTNAIEQKQIAQQEAECAKFIVKRSEQEKQTAIIRAEGDLEAVEIISTALSKVGEGFIALRRIEASKDIAQTLSQAHNITYLPSQGSGSNTLLGIQL